MAIEYNNNGVAHFLGTVSVEDAETLMAWAQQNPKARADFAACTHIHAATVQVLMAARLCVSAWPADEDFKNWLIAALGTRKEKRVCQKLS